MGNLVIDKVKDNFTIIQNIAIESDLSDGAFRVLVYIKSKSENWSINNKDIKFKFGYGDEKIAKIWKELINKGWVIREKIYKQSKFEYNYTLPINPVIHNTEIHSAVKSHTVKNIDYNNTNVINNTNINNTNINNKENIIKENDVDILLNFYSEKTDRALTKDKNIKRDIEKVLREYSLDDCKKVIEFIINNKWHIENKQDTLSSIFRPTKFHEKLERAELKTIEKSINPKDALQNCNEIFKVIGEF